VNTNAEVVDGTRPSATSRSHLRQELLGSQQIFIAAGKGLMPAMPGFRFFNVRASLFAG
jgi:hypothetical protein